MKCALIWSALSASLDQTWARVGHKHRLVASHEHAGNRGLRDVALLNRSNPSRAWPRIDPNGEHHATGSESLPFSVCAMGDSITDGVQGQDDTFVTRGGFRPKLDEWLKAKGAELTGYQTCPCPAYPGAISSKLHEQLVADHFTCGSSAGPRHPDLALVLIGVNDLGRFLKPVDVVKGMESMFLDLWKASPGTTVLLASTLVHGAYPTAELNRGLKDLVVKMTSAGHPIVYVPMQEETQMCNPSIKLCSYDLVHPNADGYSAMAQVWWEHIEPRLPKDSGKKTAVGEPSARSNTASYQFSQVIATVIALSSITMS